MVSNIDIFQGIVSKLEIPVSWQHYWLLYNTQPFQKEVKMYSSLQSNNINVSITCVHMWNSHVGRFKNTVFSLQTASGYVVNLQHICFSVNRQPCGFIQVRHTNARGCLFSIGLIFWLLHASAGLGLFPTALLRHTQFLLVTSVWERFSEVCLHGDGRGRQWELCQ